MIYYGRIIEPSYRIM